MFVKNALLQETSLQVTSKSEFLRNTVIEGGAGNSDTASLMFALL
jgi:hypothetical protein